MGDAGEGLIDADSRIQDRLEDLAREREARRAADVANPAQLQAVESLRLARAELQRQLDAATHDRRRQQLLQAIEEVERRMAEVRPVA
jgi:hypothetical protein